MSDTAERGGGFHQDPEQFRKWGHAMVDWIVDYQKRVGELPVLSQVKPGDLRAMLPASPPEKGEDFAAIAADLDRVIVPGLTHWQSPNFFGFFPANISGPSVLGELVSAGLGVQGMLWATSPACTELETHVLDWMAEMAGLPDAFKSSGSGGGVIQDSASSAVLCALLAARERATGLQTNETGCTGNLVAYASTQAHSSIEKAVKIAGIGRSNLRSVEVDQQFAMDPSRLAEMIAADREAGRKPFFVCATLGSTSSNAMDPLGAIAALCKREGLWLHVDAAMAGTAGICPEFRVHQEGLHLADSYAFNPHKWMFTNFDCDCFYVADRAALIKSLSVLPEYLRNRATESGAVIDYRDWQVPLGRRFRSLKLWFVIRHYGVEGLRHHIREHVELTQKFAGWVRDSEDFEILAPVPLNLVCFAPRQGNTFSEELLRRINSSGRAYLTHTILGGRHAIRFCVGQTHTRLEHVRDAWELICETARQMKSGS